MARITRTTVVTCKAAYETVENQWLDGVRLADLPFVQPDGTTREGHTVRAQHSITAALVHLIGAETWGQPAGSAFVSALTDEGEFYVGAEMVDEYVTAARAAFSHAYGKRYPMTAAVAGL